MIYKLLLLSLFFVVSCENSTDGMKPSYPSKNEKLITITQGVWGNVWLWEGNFMPEGWGDITPVKREIYVYELLTYEQIREMHLGNAFYTEIDSNLITKLSSDDKGFYQIEMPVGEYTLFIKEEGSFYNNGSFGITVTKDTISEMHFNIKHSAYF